jgi:uncharacterized protein YaaQ
LEKALIAEFLRARDVDSNCLQSLADDEVKRLLAEASVYAATKLAVAATLLRAGDTTAMTGRRNPLAA